MKVLNLGSINIDYVYSVPHIILPGETLSSQGLNTSPGGKGANQSVAMAKAGLNIYHAGKIGPDGVWILKKLESFGVNTDFIETIDTPSGQAIIQLSDEGENSIILFKGANHLIDHTFIKTVLLNFNKNDLLVIQNEISNISSIINHAHKIGMKICFNPAPFTNDIKNMPLDKIDYLILNEIEGSCLTDNNGDPDEILDSLVQMFPKSEIVLTLGEKGAIAYFESEKYKQEITPVKPLDTTAAGDTFVGYYMYGRTNGFNVQKSLVLASKASALTVTKNGAMDSIPFLSELN